MAALACAAVLLSGCTAGLERAAENPVLHFRSRVEVRAGEKEVSCTLSRYQGGLANVTVLSPPEVQGLRFDWDGAGFSLSFASLSAHWEQEPLPADSFAPALLAALDAAEKGLSQHAPGEFAGVCGGKAFTLTADPETGRVLSLSLPYEGISAIFYDDIATFPASAAG